MTETSIRHVGAGTRAVDATVYSLTTASYVWSCGIPQRTISCHDIRSVACAAPHIVFVLHMYGDTTISLRLYIKTAVEALLPVSRVSFRSNGPHGLGMVVYCNWTFITVILGTRYIVVLKVLNVRRKLDESESGSSPDPVSEQLQLMQLMTRVIEIAVRWGFHVLH
jgi:hypothetical protein